MYIFQSSMPSHEDVVDKVRNLEGSKQTVSAASVRARIWKTTNMLTLSKLLSYSPLFIPQYLMPVMKKYFLTIFRGFWVE